MARAAGPPGGLFLRVLGQRVATLDHEILDDPVEAGAIVEALPGQLFEIFDMPRGNVGPEFEDHFALGGFDHGNFAHIIIQVVVYLMESAGTILTLTSSTR